jgi:hypothetical protein
MHACAADACARRPCLGYGDRLAIFSMLCTERRVLLH